MVDAPVVTVAGLTVAGFTVVVAGLTVVVAGFTVVVSVFFSSSFLPNKLDKLSFNDAISTSLK